MADAALGFVLFAGAASPFIAIQSPVTDFAFLRDLAGAGGIGAVIFVVWLNLKDRKEERETQAVERKTSADLVAKEREQSALERQHSMDRIGEITETFSKTVLELSAKKD